MTEIVPKRRRWLWLIVATAFALIGGSIVWRLRPLNATERRLLGSWSPTHTAQGPFTFCEDRTFYWSHPNGFVASRGTWSCSENSLELAFDHDGGLSVKQLLFRLYRRVAGHDRQPLRFDDAGIVLRDIPYARVATPPDPDR
jgi:hypothetical protein